jgi:hypothetical protein
MLAKAAKGAKDRPFSQANYPRYAIETLLEYVQISVSNLKFMTHEKRERTI